ncbi:MAG: outer membrane beta-barrel protein [Bacteroidota bacterium]|nr:outer membrane beta-barrel protein [Bacteroidota bacterium]MDX5427190.1 outer membrane beta-barrel protein [Bacteroidota bacterium]MDX5449391.1 outer membrane beta-barrel protein [Bacteroidota bacterium]MDX5505152.1 outer membrane beta-barrel protein [Bacteroidota bacterium]
MTYRTLFGEDNYKNFVTNRNELEKPVLGYSTGIMVSKFFSKDWGFQFGMQFCKQGYVKEFQSNIGPYKITGPPSKPVEDYRYSYFYFQVPLQVFYNVSLGRNWSLRPLGGISTDIFLGMDYHKKGTSPDLQNVGLSVVNLSGIIGSELRFQISDRIGIGATPIFQHSILPIVFETPIKEFLWSTGIRFSCVLKI